MVNEANSASDTAETLLPYNVPISRSFLRPTGSFLGQPDFFINQTITWYPNGTIHLVDDKESSFVSKIDSANGTAVSLSANSLMVNHKVNGDGFEYDVNWRPVKNADGFIDRYKFDVTGSTDEARTIRLSVKTPLEKIRMHDNMIIGISDNFNLNSTVPQGIGIDWSDAIAQGHNMQFDTSNNAISLEVDRTFSVDPTTVDTISVALSPPMNDYYEGEKRLVKIGSTLFVFYYDGSNIASRYSTDNGNNWSSKLSLGTGTINSDNFRYTIVYSKFSNVDRVTLLYWNPSSTNTNFYARTYTVSGTTLTLFSSDHLFTVANYPGCGGGTCAAAVGSDDTSGNIYAAFRYLKSGSNVYYYRILKSTDGGNTWALSGPGALPETSSSTANRIEMAMTKLASDKMLFAYAKYGAQELFYRIGDGTSWTAQSTTSGAGMQQGTIKHISAASDGSNQGYIGYLTLGNSGTLKVAKFTSTGTFSAFQTVDSSQSHKLPSGTLSSVGTSKYVHFFSLVEGLVKDNRIIPNESWDTWGPFVGFNAPDQLASSINYRGIIYKEGNEIKFNIDDST